MKITNIKLIKNNLIIKNGTWLSYSDFYSGMNRNLGDPFIDVYIGNYKIASIVQDINKRWYVSNLSYTYKSQNDAVNGLLKRLNGQCKF